jgi:hypothetical protein
MKLVVALTCIWMTGCFSPYYGDPLVDIENMYVCKERCESSTFSYDTITKECHCP